MDATDRSSKSVVRVLVIAALLAATAVLGLAARDALRIRSELRAGQRALGGLTLEAAADRGLASVATEAADHLRDAADLAEDSPALSLLGHLPVLHRQVGAAREMTLAMARLGASGEQAATRLDDVLDAGLGPSGRVALLDAALEEIDRLSDDVDHLDIGDDAGLLPPLGAAHADLTSALTSAATRLEEARAVVGPVRDLVEGPATFVLLGANNAEMAGGAGLALSAGLLGFDRGAITLSDVVPAGDARLDAPVELPEELAAVYQPTGVGLDLRSTTRSPNLPAMGPVVVDLLAAQGLPGIDGVVVVDALALQRLLEVTGPVVAGGRSVDADSVVRTVLHDSYRHFDRTGDQAGRVDFQAEVAAAVVQSLTDGDAPAPELAAALLDASRGRHLMLWGADEALQRSWEAMGLTGGLPADGLLVSFQNYGADKLDWYLRPRSSLDVWRLPSGDQRARLTMTLDLPALDELDDASPYILGPDPEVHGLFLTVHLPSTARDIQTTEPTGFETKGRDGPLQVRTFRADVPLGSTFERVVEFTLPADATSMTLLPSARIEPVPLTVDGVATVDDATTRRITWLTALPRDDTPRGWFGVAGAVVGLGAIELLLRWRRRADGGRRRSGLGDGAALGA